MGWVNSDNLYVKFGREEAAVARGGEFGTADQGRHVIEFKINARDVQSATDSILGSLATIAAPTTGSYGVVVPEGFIPEFLEVTTAIAFTSTGTIGTSTMLIGTIKASDRVTELDFNGLATASFVGSVFDATAEGPTIIKVGTTGAGDDYGVAFAETGLISVSNSQHASHPYVTTDPCGELRCRLVGRFGL
jgi:hypothetical protein